MPNHHVHAFRGLLSANGESVTYSPADGIRQEGLKAVIRRGVERVGEYGTSSVFKAEIAMLICDLESCPDVEDQIAVVDTDEVFQIAEQPLSNGVFYRMLAN